MNKRVSFLPPQTRPLLLQLDYKQFYNLFYASNASQSISDSSSTMRKWRNEDISSQSV